MKSPLILYFLLSLYSFGPHSTADKMRQRLNGVELKALAFQYPPMFFYKKQPNGNYTFGGVAKELMDDAEEYFNMSVKYTILDPAEITENGFFLAVMKPLDNKEVDVVPFTFIQQDMNNLKHMELSGAVWIDHVKLLLPWPEEESRLTVTVRPFQLTVWLWFLTSTFTFILISTYLIKNKFNGADSTTAVLTGETMYRQLEFVIKITFNQGYCIQYKTRTSFKLMIGIWLLCMVVLINAYSGVLTSLLTVPKLQPIAKTLEEVAEKNVLRLTIEKNTYFSEMFLGATEGYEKTIGDRLRQDSKLMVSDVFGAVQNVAHRKSVYIGSTSRIGLMIHKDTKATGYCRMTSSNELEAYRALVYQIGFPIGSPYVATTNEFFLRLWENGLIALYRQRYFPVTDECRTDVPPKTKIGPLKLVDLTPIFLLLGLGISLSILCFLAELLSIFLKYFTTCKIEDNCIV